MLKALWRYRDRLALVFYGFVAGLVALTLFVLAMHEETEQYCEPAPCTIRVGQPPPGTIMVELDK